MKPIDSQVITKLISEAKASMRKRKNLNFHSSNDDPIQRMLNAFEPHSYVQPHAHINPNKREVFILLEGQLLVVFFNSKGDIINHVVLNRESGVYGVEILPGEWHTAISLEEGTVVYEIKDGPYDVSDDKNFASWAPNENTSEAEGIMNKWLIELGYVE